MIDIRFLFCFIEKRKTDSVETLSVFLFLWDLVSGFHSVSIPEQEGDAPQSSQSDQREDHAANSSSLATKQPANDIKLEDTDAAPVDGTDDDQDQRNLVQHLIQLLVMRFAYSMSPFPLFYSSISEKAHFLS